MTTDVVVLDTHVLVWLLEGDQRLSITARDAIGAASRVCLSAITPWEIGMLAAKGRLGFGDQDVQRERPAVPRQASLISPGYAEAASDEATSRRCGC